MYCRSVTVAGLAVIRFGMTKSPLTPLYQRGDRGIGVKLSRIPIRTPSLSLPVNGEGTHFPPLTGGPRGGTVAGKTKTDAES